MTDIKAPNGAIFHAVAETEHYVSFRATANEPKYRDDLALKDFEHMHGLGYQLCGIARGDVVIFKKAKP